MRTSNDKIRLKKMEFQHDVSRETEEEERKEEERKEEERKEEDSNIDYILVIV